MTKLENVTQWVIILACLFIVGDLGAKYWKRAFPGRLPAPFNAGDTIVDTPELGLAGARRTLLLVTASTCQYCQNSMPFFTRLSAAARKANVRVVAVTKEDLKKHREYLAAGGLYVDAVIAGSANRVPTGPTPTLLLVRSGGSVIRAWMGQVPADKESAVLNTVTAF